VFIIDTSTGAILRAENCRLIGDDDLSAAQRAALAAMPQQELCALARTRGRGVLADGWALTQIAEHLSGAEWSSDDLDFIAEVLADSGRTVKDLDD
jgi:hypothetical protein